MASALNSKSNPVPRKLRTRGLTEYHTRPLAAELKNADGEIFPQRMDPFEAWLKPYVEMNPANATALIVLDCDDPEALDRAWLERYWNDEEERRRRTFPTPSFHIRNRMNEHVQIGWVLKTPVHRNHQSKRGPQIKLGCVVGKLTSFFGADPSFRNMLSRNPAYNDETLQVLWCDSRHKGFDLDQLDIKEDRREQAVLLEQSAVGRNVSLFESLMKFAGSWKHRDEDLLAFAEQINNQFEFPLLPNEVRSTVRSVERYRAKWIEERRYYELGSSETKRNIAQISQMKSVKAQRLNTRERDRQIVRAWLEDVSIREIAGEMGLSRQGAEKIIRRSWELDLGLSKSERWQLKRRLDGR